LQISRNNKKTIFRNNQKKIFRNNKKRKFKINIDNKNNLKKFLNVFYIKKQQIINYFIISCFNTNLVIINKRSLQQRNSKIQEI